jgi:hypothetical protein
LASRGARTGAYHPGADVAARRYARCLDEGPAAHRAGGDRRGVVEYLLQAFLAYNPAFEILCANYALARNYPDRVAALISAWTNEMAPSGLWFRKVAASPA